MEEVCRTPHQAVVLPTREGHPLEGYAVRRKPSPPENALGDRAEGGLPEVRQVPRQRQGSEEQSLRYKVSGHYAGSRATTKEGF